MVKHSVPLCCGICKENVAPIPSIRCFPRPAVRRRRAAAGLSSAVRLAGPRPNPACLVTGLQPSLAYLPRPRTVERRPNRRNSRVIARGSRHRLAFCGTNRPSPRARRIRSGPLAPLLPRRCRPRSAAPRFVVAGITPAVAGHNPVSVLRCHARRLALVCRPSPLRQFRRLHRTRTLLLFPSHDLERGRFAESG